VALVAEIDEYGKGQAKADPEGGPPQGLSHGHDVGRPVEDPKVEGQEEQDEGYEAGIHPEHQDGFST